MDRAWPPQTVSRCLPERSQHRGRAVDSSAWAISSRISWLHLLLLPAWSGWCLEFTSPDLTASVSSRPHHPILSASHLASTSLIVSLTISPVLDRLPPSSQILLPWPLKLNTNLFRKRSMLLLFYFILLALLTPSHPELQALSLQSQFLPFTLLPPYFPQTNPSWIQSHRSNICSTCLPPTCTSPSRYSNPRWWSRHHPKCITLRTEHWCSCPLSQFLSWLLCFSVSPFPQAQTWNHLPFLFSYIPSCQILWTLPLKCLLHSSFKYLLPTP